MIVCAGDGRPAWAGREGIQSPRLLPVAQWVVVFGCVGIGLGGGAVDMSVLKNRKGGRVHSPQNWCPCVWADNERSFINAASAQVALRRGWGDGLEAMSIPGEMKGKTPEEWKARGRSAWVKAASWARRLISHRMPVLSSERKVKVIVRACQDSAYVKVVLGCSRQ